MRPPRPRFRATDATPSPTGHSHPSCVRRRASCVIVCPCSHPRTEGSRRPAYPANRHPRTRPRTHDARTRTRPHRDGRGLSIRGPGSEREECALACPHAHPPQSYFTAPPRPQRGDARQQGSSGDSAQREHRGARTPVPHSIIVTPRTHETDELTKKKAHHVGQTLTGGKE